MALKFALLSLALLGYCSVSVNASCVLERSPDTVLTPTVDDNTRVGDIVGVFKVDTSVVADFPADPVQLANDELKAAFRVSVIKLDAGANPVPPTRAVILQINDGFKDWVDVHNRDNPVHPEFTLTCAPGDVGKPEPGFLITIGDTNNHAPTFDDVKGFEVDNTKWKKGEKINTAALKLKDADTTVADNVLSVEAKFVDAAITQKFKKIEVSTRENNGQAANFDLILDEQVVSGNHTVTLTATDGAEGHQIKQDIIISFTGGAMQAAGAFVMVTLFSLISTFISN